MKKFLKQLICFFLALCIGAGGMLLGVSEMIASAESYSGVCGNGAEWYFDADAKKLVISGSGTTGSYSAVLGTKAPWHNCKEKILYVEIGEGITSIGAGSFQDCGNLLGVEFPDSLKVISEMSFSGCNKLQTVFIPANVNKIDASAFLECTVLENVTVDAGNNYYCSDNDGVLFNKAKTKLVLFPKGKITTEYSIPSGVTEIGEYAFANCSELINISIPVSVNTIGINAFYNCRTLLSADIPEGVTAIKSNTFYGCSALYEVKLPSTVTVIGSNAFGKCGSLMKINVPNATKSIDASAFSSSPNLKIYCDKDSEAHKFCVANSIDFHYSNIASLYPMPTSTVYNGHTYGRYDVACTWEEAKLVCEMVGGHLVTITSQKEQDAVNSLISGGNAAYWIGATDRETEGTWEWVTGEKFDFNVWRSGQPDNYEGVEEYAEIINETKYWNDNKLDAPDRGFICEYEVFYIPDKTINYNGHIYSLYNESLTWTEAKAFCESVGGHLVTVSSQAEQDAVNQLFELPKKALYWIGFYDSNLDGAWEWVTGEPVVYTNWGSGEPNGASATTHTYAQMYSTNYSEIKGVGCWNDEYNDGNGTAYYRLANIGFICETEPENFSPSASGYYNGNRYEIYSNNVSWESAKAYAQTKGGHLVTVTDGDEAAYLHTLYKDLTLADDYLFTGGFRYKHETDYRWVTGERYSYSNWNSGEPNNNSGVENLIQIYRYSNGWNDIGNRGSWNDGNVFIIEYESPKQVLSLSNPDGTIFNRYKVQGGLPVDEPLKDYRPGYTSEWYKDASLQNKWNFETDVITEDTVLYAKFTPETYIVDFESDGGDCSTDSKSVTFGASYGQLPSPTREGYTFVGWHTDEAFTKVVENSTPVSIAENHTLYAKWQAKTYTVNFDCCGGVSDVTSKTVVFDEPYGELPLCSRLGSEFIGWYLDLSCTNLVDENSIACISQNHTLYAGWNESTVTGIKLISKPDKTEYYVGDTLDTTGLCVQATYENGTVGELSADKMIYSTTEFISAGKKIIKVNCGDKYVSFVVNVKEKEPTSVSIDSMPQKLEYTVGESIDTTGLALTVSYSDSSTETITEGYTVKCDLSKVGTKNVTVEYTTKGVTLTTAYIITVKEPERTVVSAQSVTASSGEMVTVPFIIEKNKGVLGFAIIVEYDTDAFTPISVSAGEIIKSGSLNDNIGTTEKTLKVVYTASDEMVANGELFAVNFAVNKDALGDYKFKLSYLQDDTFDGNYRDVIFDCKDFSLTIKNSTLDSMLRVYAEDKAVKSDTRITVPIKAENCKGLNSFSIKMTYDPTVLEFIKIKSGEILSSARVESVVTGSEIVLTWKGSDLTDDGIIAYITFDVAEFCNETSVISLECVDVGFSNGYEKQVYCNDITLKITNRYEGKSSVIYSDKEIEYSDSGVVVPVYISNNNGLMGFSMNIKFDSKVLIPTKINRGSVLSNGTFDYNLGKYADSVKVIWNNTEDIKTNGLLFMIYFDVAENVQPTTLPMEITYDVADTYNEKWEDVKLEIDIATRISYIKLDTPVRKLQIGDAVNLSAEYLGNDETVKLIWSSQNPLIATVDEYGNVKALKEGNVRITVETSDGRHKESVVLTVTKNGIAVRIISDDGSLDKKISWWKKYATATMKLGFNLFNADRDLRFEWKSSNPRVKIDQNGNITNKGSFARSSIITLTAYDAEGNVVTQSSVRVSFYKFNWQKKYLQTRNLASDFFLVTTQGIHDETDEEAETIASAFSVFIDMLFSIFNKGWILIHQ